MRAYNRMIKFVWRRQSLLKEIHSKIRYFCGQREPKEIIDSYWEIEEKVDRLAELITQVKYPIFFTGAGISTSIGIPDYRSGENTVIKTGAGLWNRKQLKLTTSPHQIPIDKLVDIAYPSLTHRCIASLIKKGLMKHVVSQNTDGLHLRSGVLIENISELHGNRNLQFCISCNMKYFRPFRTVRRDNKKYQPGQKREHNTGRKCENCGGDLHDSIIYFGQKLPKDQLASGYAHGHRADLCICIGSSLTVKPSSNIPMMALQKEQPGKLCIINIQETPLDPFAELRINYFCDDVMELLAKKLNIQIENLVIKHHLKVSLRECDEWQIVVEGQDQNGNNLSFMRDVSFVVDGQVRQSQMEGHQSSVKIQSEQLHKDIWIQVFHYGNEKPLLLNLDKLQLKEKREKRLQYQMQQSKQWQIIQ